MTPQEFLDEFGTLAESAQGVPKLRELILELAVRGKLVEQDKDDKPATVLRETIASERKRLHDAAEIRKPKLLPALAAEEEPYPLPAHWEWVRLNEICVLENGDRSKNYPNKSALVDEGIPFINAGHLQHGAVDMREMNFITPERFEILRSGKVRPDDILFCLRGSLGKCAVVHDIESGAIASSLVIVRLFHPLTASYFLKYFTSPLSMLMVRKFDNGTAQPNLSATDLAKFAVPLPPLAEQHRIVSKVDELMGLCDRLEAVQGERRGVRVRLNRSSLDRLTSSSTARGSGLTAAWQRVCDHFEVLYDTPETLPDLRQTILQLAVQGKLVSQDDEDAELLSRDSSVGDFLTMQNGYAFKSTWFEKSGIRLVRNANIGHGELNWSDVAKVSEERAIEFERFALEAGDIVLSLDRPLITTGLKVARLRQDDLPSLLLQRVARPVFRDDTVDPHYFYMWLQSPAFIDSIDPGKSNGVPHISTKEVLKIEFAPPTRKSQKRIVSKVTQLLSQVTRLASTLPRREATRTQLLTAAIHSILGDHS